MVNNRNEVLLLRHRFRETQQWELPGGFVEGDERLEDALQRELTEETGLTVEVLSLLSVGVSRARHLDVCYLARVVGGSLRLDNQEILEAGFYSFGDLPPNLRAEQLRNIGPAHEQLDHPTVQ